MGGQGFMKKPALFREKFPSDPVYSYSTVCPEKPIRLLLGLLRSLTKVSRIPFRDRYVGS